MLKENHLNLFRKHGVLVARILVGAMFLLAGLSKLRDLGGTEAYINSVGIPAPALLALLVGLFELIAGAIIIFGVKYFREAALLLAVFTLFVSFPFHGPSMWAENPMQQVLFMKNMAIIAGLLYMVAYGSGKQ